MAETETTTGKFICPTCQARYQGGSFCARDGAPLVAEPNQPKQELVGEVLAERYRIVRLIGQGGMGQVYEAQHVNINRRFALKLLRPEILTDAEAVARFRQEAWSASSIGHDNIIQIDDFATLPDGKVYLAMEFLQGMSLSERLKQKPPLDVNEALTIIRQVASGLGAAHEKGIVHRDLKPENIFLAEKFGGTVCKILDFGIAKVLGAEASERITRTTGAVFGTPHYMAPEQALGASVDHRADIYSLGVILYEMFAGKVPFDASSYVGILTKHVTETVRPPSEISEREISPAIESLILRAMAKEANARFQSMAEFEAALDGLANDRSVAPFHATLSPSVKLRTAEISALPRRRFWPLLAAGLLLTGGTLVYALRSSLSAQDKPAPKPIATSPTIVVPAGSASTRATAGVEVIVDSLPPKAKILRAGVVVAETPETFSVFENQPIELLLRKEGYVEQKIHVDPKNGHKVLVRLERHHDHASFSALPHLVAPADSAPVRIEPERIRAPALRSRNRSKPVDPYERVEERGKPHSSEVINPYQ